MTAEELAFVRGVCAEPADDTVRLVYADYMEETGRAARAELVRTQVELAALEAGAARPVTPNLRSSAGRGVTTK